MAEKFKALLVEQPEKKQFTRSIVTRSIDDLPDGDLVIRVAWSSLNYKDALSATGHPGVTRGFPHTPGIDAAGRVVSDATGRFQPGDEVLVTGFDLGMETDGGFGQVIRIPSEWAVALPDGLSARESMIIGTAGFTAALSVWKMVNNGVRPEHGDVLVTGATGGVGSVSTAILTKAGYRVVGATLKGSESSFLKDLGASEIISRDDVLAGSERPMMKERWAGVIDCVGGEMLAAAIKSTKYGGTVTCCGLVGSIDLNVNVYPFILRGVSLLGIDSVQCPMEPRLKVWEKLANEWKVSQLDKLATECSLDDLEEKISEILKGQLRGRTIVNLDL
ncbi:MAG: YhdH/YhfP family quinone oxidoreductase [Deltaproteobacteria bacterium]|jgi:putative YhdH/YhfP family quinone oxidoreductase|nr:YhdH/YhfP family quinone oxidoreductase [Deltaproteobacteria bacterium]MBW2476409.1 YhdH/YhfP family quinone oxidoreductase [Deltaproteobacteria bacterium]MBW2503467.1 YhdH/YhfP family quinone oxidoreductase [Deltaproteobacteria bacterium]